MNDNNSYNMALPNKGTTVSDRLKAEAKISESKTKILMKANATLASQPDMPLDEIFAHNRNVQQQLAAIEKGEDLPHEKHPLGQPVPTTRAGTSKIPMPEREETSRS